MTEPDPEAGLAGQIEDLRGQLARYAGEVGQLRAQAEENSGQDVMIRLEIKRLAGKLDEALSKRDTADPPAPFWLRLDDQERAARLAELRDWVDKFARVQYPAYLDRLPACWANHPDAIWELSNLMTEWTRVYGDPDSRPLQDALWFHERWLPGALGRLAPAIRCDATGCRAVRSSPLQRLPPRYT